MAPAPSSPPPSKAGTGAGTAGTARASAAAPPASPPPRTNSGAVPMYSQKGYEGQIRFVDDEVARMHAELDRRERERSLLPRQTGKSTLKHQRPRKSGITLTGFLVRVSIFYVLIAYYLVCPTDHARDRAVCRQLDRVTAKLHSFEPHAQPYLDYAHRKAEPYIADFHARTGPYLAHVQPFVDRADAIIEPWTKKVGQVYNSHVYPGIVKGIHTSQAATKPYVARAQAQYQKSLAPSVEWYSRAGQHWYKSNAEKHVKSADKLIRSSSQQAYDFVAPALPFAHHHLQHTVLPATKTAYKTSHETYFEHLHPRVVVAGGHLHQFWRTRVVPAWHRFYSLYIAPQVDKISERVFEYKSKKSQVETQTRMKAAEAEIMHDKHEDVFADFMAEPDEPAPVVESAPPAYTPVQASVDETKPSPEEKAKATAEKRVALEALQKKYEQEIENLGQAQHDLVVKRLVAIRTQANADIFDRFDSPLIKLNAESDKMIERLANFLTREDGRTKEQKLADGATLCTKAKAKITGAGDKVKVEADKYRDEVIAKEFEVVETASAAVEQLVTKAQTELGHGWTWLDSVTVKDWDRYHGLLKAQKKWQDHYTGLQTGAVYESEVATVRPRDRLDQAKSEVDTVLAKLESTLDRNLKKASGTVIGSVVDSVTSAAADAKEALDDSQKSLAASAASVASVARESASSILAAAAGVLPTDSIVSVLGGESTPTDIVGSASSVASAAAASAQTALGDASQAVLRAVGIEPSPTNAQQTVGYVAKVASSSVVSVASAASETLVNDLPSVVSSAAAAATEYAGSIASEVTSTVAVVASSVFDGAASASSVVSSLAAPHSSFTKSAILEQVTASVQSVVSDASSILHDATRTTAEGVYESASSVASVLKSAVYEHIEL